MRIRVAQPEELALLPEIERASGELFRDIGMPEIADDDVLPVEILALHHVWVAADLVPVAFIAVGALDGAAHIEQVSVHPSHARRGIGRRLIDHVEAWAATQGLTALTLTTFRDVPWNGPYYERLGFRELTEPTPGLAVVVAEETARGLDPATRICMRREIHTYPRPRSPRRYG
jgi:GNAT superfamily N-acetyltransferase